MYLLQIKNEILCVHQRKFYAKLKAISLIIILQLSPAATGRLILPRLDFNADIGDKS
jgi:hypothetical protein